MSTHRTITSYIWESTLGMQETPWMTWAGLLLLGWSGAVQAWRQAESNSAPMTSRMMEALKMKTPSVSDTASQAGGSVGKRYLNSNLCEALVWTFREKHKGQLLLTKHLRFFSYFLVTGVIQATWTVITTMDRTKPRLTTGWCGTHGTVGGTPSNLWSWWYELLTLSIPHQSSPCCQDN